MYAGYSFSQYSFFIGGQQNLNGPIVIDRYDCNGTETTLSDCAAYDYATSHSTCSNSGGVSCEGNGVAQICEQIIKQKYNCKSCGFEAQNGQNINHFKAKLSLQIVASPFLTSP